MAVNCSAESPDGGALVTLGDDNNVLLHRRDASGRALPCCLMGSWCPCCLYMNLLRMDLELLCVQRCCCTLSCGC